TLAATLGSLAAQPSCACVVVDYSSPDRCGEWVLEHHPSVRVVRVDNQMQFDPAITRNLGAAAAAAPWLCFVALNIRNSPKFPAAVLPILRTGSWYAPDPPLDRDASLLICTRDDFHRAGGYDEVPPCWTELEDDFRDALSLSGARQATFPAALIQQV